MTARNRNITADACLQAIDAEFFRALCEPSRLDVFRAMIKLGPADVGEIAGQTPQDRSVVSRHLQVLQRAGLAVSHKEGRRVIYQVDGPAMLNKLTEVVAAVETLVPLCCPGSKTCR